MTKRFVHICLFALLSLLCFVADVSAQVDTTRFAPDTLRLGSILPGTIHRDTAFLVLQGRARIVSFTSSDTALRVSIVNPYQFSKGLETLAVPIQIVSRRLGQDTLFLAAVDSVDTDTLVLLFSSTPQSSFRISPDTIRIGQLMVGATVDDSFFIVNEAGDLRIEDLSIPDSSRDSLNLFGLQLPALIQQGTSRKVSFNITPKDTGARSIHLIFVDSNAATRTAVILIEGILPSSLDSVFTLVRPSTLGRITNEDEFTINLRMVNDGPDTIDIQDFIIDDTVNFGIEDFPLLPLIIPPDSATPPIEVYAKKTGSGFFRTNVRVPTVGGLASEYTVGIQVLKMVQASVPPTRTRSGIILFQSGTELGIEGLPFDTGKLVIYDLLGREVAQHTITSREMMIAKQDASGYPIEDGCYIIRVSDSKGSFSESIKTLLISY